MGQETQTADVEPVDTFSTEGVTAALTNERVATPAEHRANGAIAYTVSLYEGEEIGGEPVFSTTYTIGPGISEARARNALWALAGDALAVQNLPAELPEDPTDLSDPEVREAIQEFSLELGYSTGDLSDALDAFTACVETLEAFNELGLDAANLYDRLDR